MVPILSAILPLVGDVIDRVVPDKNGNAKAKREIEQTLATAAMKGQLGQLEINKVEAAHRSVWTSGWRPSVGWCCSLALFFHFIVAPIVQWAGGLWGVQLPLPVFQMDALLYVLGSLLGVAGLRTYEKQKGLTR